MTVYVTLPELTELRVWGGSHVLAKDSLASIHLTKVSSGSEVELEGINSLKVTVDISSGSSATLQGECDLLIAEASSGADLRGKGLRCETAVAEANSGSSTTVYAEQVEARAYTGGHINIYGATEVTAKVGSGGHVARHD